MDEVIEDRERKCNAVAMPGMRAEFWYKHRKPKPVSITT